MRVLIATLAAAAAVLALLYIAPRCEHTARGGALAFIIPEKCLDPK